MLVLSRKVKWLGLGASLLVLAGALVVVFGEVDLYLRGKAKQKARTAVEEIVTAALEQKLLPPIRKVLSSSEFCRAPGACELKPEWNAFDPDPHDILFSTDGFRRMSFRVDQRPEHLEVKVGLNLGSLNAREFLESPQINTRGASWYANIALYGADRPLRFAQVDPRLRQLFIDLARVMVNDSTFDLQKLVLDPCEKRQPAEAKFGQVRADTVRCVVREEPESMENFLKRKHGQTPSRQLLYFDLDVRTHYFERFTPSDRR